MARLVIYEESEEDNTIFEVFELSAPRLLIGSSMDNELILDTPDVDAGHASLELRHDQWVLQDLGSGKGTKVNARSVSGPHFLQHNDLIEIGGVKLRFQETEDALIAEESKEEDEEEEEDEEQPVTDEEPPLSGRVWFAGVAGVTIAVIFIILLLLIVADFMGLFRLADLVPWP